MQDSTKNMLKTKIENQRLKQADIMRLSPAELYTDLAGDGGTVLHYVSCKGTNAMVKWVLEALGTEAQTMAASQDNDGLTPLHLVALKLDIEAIKLMLAALGPQASDVAALPDNNGSTPLHIVALKQGTETVKLMLAALGPQAPTVAAHHNNNGSTPLHIAVANQDTEAVKLMLAALGPQASTLFTQRNSEGYSLKDYARINKQHPKVLTIIRKPKRYLKKTPNMPPMPPLPSLEDFQRTRETTLKSSQTLLQETTQTLQQANQAQALPYLQVGTPADQTAMSVPPAPQANPAPRHQTSSGSMGSWSQAKPQPTPTREDFEKLIIPHEDITLGAAIGSGSFGQVYQARWIVEEVAVKRLMPNLNMVNELEDEFLHEVTVMSQLKSKYIVPLRGITVSPYGMVMEYMPQGTLSHLLHESEIPVPASLQYRLANDIVKGMAFLHHHCILHRDLKSDNILLTQNYEARLADFGLAKIKNVSSQSSKTGSMVGTVPYTAPEILDDEGDQKYLPASDVYSYGVVVWEITARQRPWANKGALFIIANVAVKGKRELIPPHAPKILQDVTAQAWAQAPAQRPSMMAILQQLEAAPVEAEDVAAQHPRAKGPAQGDLTPNWATGGRGPGVNPAQLGHFAGGRAQADRGGLRGNQDSHAPRGKYGGKRGHGGLRGNFDSQAPRPRGVDGGW